MSGGAEWLVVVTAYTVTTDTKQDLSRSVNPSLVGESQSWCLATTTKILRLQITQNRNLPKTDHTERGKIGRAADSKPPSVWVALSKYHHRNTVSMQTEITCQHTATRTQLMSGTPFWLLWQHGLRSSKGAQSRSGEDLLTGDGG